MTSKSLETFDKQFNTKPEVKELSSQEKELQKFQQELKKNTDSNPVPLAEFEKQLQTGNVGTPGVVPTNQVKVQKNIVLSFVSDATGCGHIRNVFPMTFLNGIFGKTGQLMTVVSPFFITQQDILIKARSIYFQRQMSPQHLGTIQEFKRLQQHFKYKMVWDMDDFIWGKNELQGGNKEDGVPSYNFGMPGITPEVKSASVEIMNMMDICTFSTQYLADYAKNVLKVKAQCIVLPNVLPKFHWGEDKKPDITERLVKPRVLYNGSPTHYHNVKKLLGDFENPWRKWVIDMVNEDKIDFHVMGGLPWFFESIKKKIKMYDWVDSYRYHNLVKSVKADLAIMPLVPNSFNYSKSDLKYLEMSIIGAPACGSVFTNSKPSPYDVCVCKMPDDCTIDDINEWFDKICEPEEYNRVKNLQYKFLEEDHRYMEDSNYINLLTQIF